MTSLPAGGPAPGSAGPRPRLRACVEAWPGCYTMGYDPRCCRFPKSCSATVYDDARVSSDDLEEMPSLFLALDEVTVSTAELDELARRWRENYSPRDVRLLTPLPRRTRLRLAIHRHITRLGEWTGDHVSWTATEWLWRATGLLGRKR